MGYWDTEEKQALLSRSVSKEDPRSLSLASIEGSTPEWDFDFGERFEAGVQSSFGDIWALGSLGADAVGLEGVQEWTMERANKMYELAGDHDIQTTSFDQVLDNPLDVGKFIYEGITGSLPSLIGAAVSGGATAYAGAGAKILAKKGVKSAIVKAAGKDYDTLWKKLVKEGAVEKVAKKKAFDVAEKNALRRVGVAGYTAGQGAGGQYNADVKLNGLDEASPGKALLAGAGMGVLTAVSPIDKMLAGKFGQKSLRDIGVATVGEMFEESGQEAIAVLHEAGVDSNTTVMEAFTNLETYKRMAGSGLVGAAMGGAGGALSTMMNRAKDPVNAKLDEAGLGSDEDVNDTIKLNMYQPSFVDDGTDRGAEQKAKNVAGAEVNIAGAEFKTNAGLEEFLTAQTTPSKDRFNTRKTKWVVDAEIKAVNDRMNELVAEVPDTTPEDTRFKDHIEAVEAYRKEKLASINKPSQLSIEINLAAAQKEKLDARNAELKAEYDKGNVDQEMLEAEKFEAKSLANRKAIIERINEVKKDKKKTVAKWVKNVNDQKLLAEKRLEMMKTNAAMGDVGLDTDDEQKSLHYNQRKLATLFPEKGVYTNEQLNAAMGDAEVAMIEPKVTPKVEPKVTPKVELTDEEIASVITDSGVDATPKELAAYVESERTKGDYLKEMTTEEAKVSTEKSLKSLTKNRKANKESKKTKAWLEEQGVPYSVETQHKLAALRKVGRTFEESKKEFTEEVEAGPTETPKVKTMREVQDEADAKKVKLKTEGQTAQVESLVETYGEVEPKVKKRSKSLKTKEDRAEAMAELPTTTKEGGKVTVYEEGASIKSPKMREETKDDHRETTGRFVDYEGSIDELGDNQDLTLGDMQDGTWEDDSAYEDETPSDSGDGWVAEGRDMHTLEADGVYYIAHKVGKGSWEILSKEIGSKGDWEVQGTGLGSADDAKAAARPVANSSADVLVEQLTKSEVPEVAALAKLIGKAASHKLGDIGVKDDALTSGYHTRHNIITLAEEANDWEKLHELIHAVTVRELLGNETVKSTIGKVMKALQDTGYELDPKVVKYKEEFLATALSDPAMQKALRDIKLSKRPGDSAIKTLWDLVLRTVGKALGLSPNKYTELDRLLTTLAKVAESRAVDKSTSRNHIWNYIATGIKAEGNETSYAKAEKMWAEGVDPDVVQEETGWRVGADGQKRYLITTDDFVLDEDRVLSDVGPLEDLSGKNQPRKVLVSYPMKQLVDATTAASMAYPELFNTTKVNFVYDDDITNAGEATVEKNGTRNIYINLNIPNSHSYDEVLIHEYQHIVQAYEGFSTGTSREDVKDFAYTNTLNQLLRTVDAEGIAEAKRLEVAYQETLRDTEWLDPEKEAKYILENYPDKPLDDKTYKLLQSLLDATEESVINDIAYEIYATTLGEMEAVDASVNMDIPQALLNTYNMPDTRLVIDNGEIPAMVLMDGDMLGEFSMTDDGVVTGVDKAGKSFRVIAGQASRKTIGKLERKIHKKRSEDEKIAQQRALGEKGASESKLDYYRRELLKGFKNTVEGTYSRIKRISPKIARLLRKAEFNIDRDEKRWRDSSRDYFEGLKRLTPGDNVVLKSALLNGNTGIRDKILKAYGLLQPFKKVEGVLEEIRDRSIKTGLIYKGREDYYPSEVTDLDGFFEFFHNRGKDKTFGQLDYVLKQKEIQKGSPLTKEEQREVVLESLKRGNYGNIPRPGSTKQRTVSQVPDGALAVYADPSAAMQKHITEMAEALNFAEALGFSNRKGVMKELRGLEEGTPEWEAKAGELETLEDDLDGSISGAILNEVPFDKTEEVKGLLKARINQRGVSGIWGNLRDISYMSVLANPMSALTQLSDLALTFFNEGPTATIKGLSEAVKAMKNKSTLADTELDLGRSTTEFSESDTAGKLDLALRWSGLKGMDILGKETALRASRLKWAGATEAEFKDHWSDILGSKTDATYKALQKGEMNEDVLFMMFNSLADRQPITLSQMPKKYLEAGNGRIFYMLKSFSLTFANMAVDQARAKWDKGDKLGAVKQVTGLLGIMTLAGAGADELKDLLTGKDEAFSDKLADNLLSLLFLNKYSLEKGMNTGKPFENILKDTLLPPTRIGDDLANDVMSLFGDGEVEFKSLRNIPVAGAYLHTKTKTGKSGQIYGEKKDILRDVKGGANISDVRDRVIRYNKKVREYGDPEKDLLTYDKLNRARKNK